MDRRMPIALAPLATLLAREALAAETSNESPPAGPALTAPAAKPPLFADDAQYWYETHLRLAGRNHGVTAAIGARAAKSAADDPAFIGRATRPRPLARRAERRHNRRIRRSLSKAQRNGPSPRRQRRRPTRSPRRLR
jgi:hypothetical protein